ncbi:putative leader peptide [Streptomyces viridosporus]|uniref:putative leader peptide n=1 Tax=Streptomyces viridosporus TaxID=67581 RepID=UPI00331D6615
MKLCGQQSHEEEGSTVVAVRRTFAAVPSPVTCALTNRRHIDLARVASAFCR